MKYSIALVLAVLLNICLLAQNKSEKRGICGNASVEDLSVFAPYVKWYYNWSIAPPSTLNNNLSGIEWVPMQWGSVSSSQVADIESKVPAGSKYLLGFNEPNFKSQSNITPEQAAAMWPYLDSIAKHKGLALVAPAVNWCGDCVSGVTSDPVDWLDKFITACPNCKFDYIAIHNYNSYLSTLKWYIGKFKKYGKPIWITEFAPWDDPVDYTGVVNYMKEAVPYLESEPLIFRYSWFATRVGSNPNLNLLDKNGELTKLGKLYSLLSFTGDTTTADVAPLVILPSEKNTNIPSGQTSASLVLDGNYYDRDSDIVTINWTQISGPTQAVFSSNTVSNPTVSNLLKGTYVFQMTALANSKSDSARITVNVSAANIALNKPATASSTQNDNSASRATDGSLTTRWSSLDSDPQWIKIDLQANCDITGAKIIWEAAFAKKYTIDVSKDGNNWTTVYSTTSGSGGTSEYSFSAVGRYIRMYSTERNNTAQYWGNSIYEFEVYGRAAVEINNTQSDKNDLLIYPNPCKQLLNIELPENYREYKLTIFNNLGKIVFYKTIKANDKQIAVDVSTLEPGVYYIKTNYSQRDFKNYFVKIQ